MKPTILREAEYRRTTWDLTAEKGVDPKAILQPSFWAHVAGRLKVGDRIEVTAFDGSWLAELIVRSKPVGRATEAKVAMLHFHDLQKADKAAKELTEEEGVEVVYKGPTLKFCVVRKSDKTIISERHDTREEAQAVIDGKPDLAKAA